MKFEKVILLIATGVVFGWGLAAQAEDAKIGFVDAQQVLATVESGKKAQEELERKARDAQGRLTPLIEQLEALQKELQAKQFVMSKDAVQVKQLDMAELRSRIESQGQEEKSKLEIDQQRLIGPLQDKFLEVIKEIGRDEGYSAIFLSDAPGLVYRREALDVTDLVIKTFNARD
jgi:outer membrane protein